MTSGGGFITNKDMNNFFFKFYRIFSLKTAE